MTLPMICILLRSDSAFLLIGDLLPSWYDDMCADIRDIDMPERLTERSLFSELTVEQLSLLESSEQVPVPWDM